jgi:UDP:flavonoid glycosyltransferase YjiC (YdhE family)
MSRILLAWELGAASGHLAGLRPVVEVLLERGHQVTLAAQNLRNAARVFAGLDFPIVPAPRTHELYGGLEDPPLNYSEILMRYGYLEPAMLRGLLTAWRSLMRAVAADVVLADHAPTAMLAARELGLPRGLIGSPFNVPPAVTPTPNMRDWLSVPAQRLADSDARVLQVINGAVSRAGNLDALHRIFDGAARFLSGIPELDPYGARPAEDYLGLRAVSTGSEQPVWPEGDGPKVFAYLHAPYSHLERALTALTGSGARVLVHLLGGNAALMQKHSGPQLRFAPALLDFSQVVSACDLCVCHGNVGTTLGMLQGGRPLLLLPAARTRLPPARRRIARVLRTANPTASAAGRDP